MRKITMAISGMTCGGCVSAVREALRTVQGVGVDAVSVGSATIRYDPSRTTVAEIAQAVRDAGYQPKPVGARMATRLPVAAAGGCCGGKSGSRCD